jgi:hypothetical protein
LQKGISWVSRRHLLQQSLWKWPPSRGLKNEFLAFDKIDIPNLLLSTEIQERLEILYRYALKNHQCKPGRSYRPSEQVLPMLEYCHESVVVEILFYTMEVTCILQSTSICSVKFLFRSTYCSSQNCLLNSHIVNDGICCNSETSYFQGSDKPIQSDATRDCRSLNPRSCLMCGTYFCPAGPPSLCNLSWDASL